MKRIFYLLSFVFLLSFATKSQAQVNVSINIGSQPLWGPVGYEYVRYYYLPEIDAYYNVATRKFTYWKGNKWVTKSKLPSRYNNFNLYRTYKVVVNHDHPWNNHRHIKHQYSRYANHRNQHVLRDVKRERVANHAPSRHKDNDRKNNKKGNNHKRENHNDRFGRR